MLGIYWIRQDSAMGDSHDSNVITIAGRRRRRDAADIERARDREPERGTDRGPLGGSRSCEGRTTEGRVKELELLNDRLLSRVYDLERDMHELKRVFHDLGHHLRKSLSKKDREPSSGDVPSAS